MKTETLKKIAETLEDIGFCASVAEASEAVPMDTLLAALPGEAEEGHFVVCTPMEEDDNESEPQPQKPQAEPVSPEVQQLLQERDRALSEMRRLNDAIQDPTLSQQIDRLEHTTQKIMDAVVKSPDKLPQIRRFLNYYLPTTLKLLNAYDRMDATGVEGANIDGTKGRIEDIMSTICTAFDRQLDALYGQEAMDISTDIDVLEQMLAREGLGSMNLSTDDIQK